MPPAVKKSSRSSREDTPPGDVSGVEAEAEPDAAEEDGNQGDENRAQSDEEGDDAKQYEVEAIVGKRYHMYKVQWKGWEDATWEPVANLEFAKELCDEYDRKVAREKLAKSSGKAKTTAKAKPASAPKRVKREPSSEVEVQQNESDEEVKQSPATNGRRQAGARIQTSSNAAHKSAGRPRGRAAVGKKEVSTARRVEQSTSHTNGHDESPRKNKRTISVVENNEAAFEEENGGHEIIRIIGHKPVNPLKLKVNVADELQYLVVYRGHGDQYVNYQAIMANPNARENLVDYLMQLANVIPRR